MTAIVKKKDTQIPSTVFVNAEIPKLDLQKIKTGFSKLNENQEADQFDKKQDSIKQIEQKEISDPVENSIKIANKIELVDQSTNIQKKQIITNRSKQNLKLELNEIDAIQNKLKTQNLDDTKINPIEELANNPKNETIKKNKTEEIKTVSDSEKPVVENKIEEPLTLAGKLKSANFKIRQEAYNEIKYWNNAEITPEIFARNLHNYLKDKHPLSIEALLGTIDSLFDNHPTCMQWVDLKSTIENIAEHLYSNVKGPSKEKTQIFVVRLWEQTDFEDYLEQLNQLLISGKPKRQEGVLNIVSELVRQGKIDEMKQLKSLWTEIGKLVNSRTVALKNQTIELYKETYLWMGDNLRPFLKELKKQQMDDLDVYFKSLGPSKMKTVEKKVPAVTKSVVLSTSEISKGTKEINSEETLKMYNVKWVGDVLAIKNAKEQTDKIEELNDKLLKTEILKSKFDHQPFLDLIRIFLASDNQTSQSAVAKTSELLAEKLGKTIQNSVKDFHKIMLPKIGEKILQKNFMTALNSFYKLLSLNQICDDLKLNLSSKNTDVVLQTLFLIKKIFDSPEKCEDEEKAIRLCELVLKFVDDKNNELKNVSQQIIAGQLDFSETKIQPLLKNISAGSLNSINQISTSIKLNKKACMSKEDTGQSDSKQTRTGSKSNALRILQIKEDAFGNKIIKTSDAKNFGSHLLKNLNFLLELTGEFKQMFTEEASEMLSFVDCLVKVEKLVLTEPIRCILIQFFVEQFNNSPNDQISNSFDQFCAFALKTISNKVFLAEMFNLLLKKQTKVNNEFFQVLVAMVDKEVAQQTSLAGFMVKPLSDFLKFQFGNESIQIVFKTQLINTMRLIMKKFGEKSVADFPAVLLNEFDAINEAQKVFEKTIEKLHDKYPEKRKAALIELADYNDPSTILTFWSNDKFISFLKRQITIETKSANYIVLIKILDHYLEIRTISFADFNIKTYIYIFHAVLMNFYDRKEDSHLKEIETLIRKSVQILTSNLILNEMIQADMNSLSWKEQILNFLNEHSAEVEPSMKILNYLIQILHLKNTGKEYNELLTQIFLRFKNSKNEEILAKGNENKQIREIWSRNEESLFVNAEFVRGNSIFESEKTFANIRQFLMKNLKIDERNFYARNIESIDFKANETSFKTKMAYWFIRSVENNARNNDFIIRQMYINESYQEDEIALALATKIVLQVLKNLFHFNTDMFFDNAFRLMGQITMHLGMEGINRVTGLLELDTLDYEFFNLILTNVSNENDDDRFNQNTIQFGKNTNNFRNDVQIAKSPIGQKENGGNFDLQIVNMKKAQTSMPVNYEYENNYDLAQKGSFGTLQAKNQPERVSASLPNKSSPQLNTRSKNERQKPEDDQLEEYTKLQKMFNKMRTYELDEFENASNYFKEICSSKKSSSLNFLTENSCEIVDNFVEVCQTIFNMGINFELKKTDYELIFVPLIMLFEKENFLLSMTREKIVAICEFIINQFIMSNEEKKEMDVDDHDTFEVAEYIVKVWNSLLLRVIDNSDPNMVIHALFYLVNNSQKGQHNKIVEAEVNLALKCVLRISKNLGNFIDRLNPAIVLSAINTYIRTFDVQNAEQLGTKVVKNLLTDFVNMIEPDLILDNYYVMFGRNEESTLLKWILTIQNKKGHVSDGSSQLIDLINDLNKQPTAVQIKTYFSRFQKTLAAHPTLKIKNYEDYFNSREQFTQIVKAMNYYSVSASQEQRQGGSLANSVKSNNERAKVIQGTTSALSNANKGRKGGMGNKQERNNFQEINEGNENE